MTNRMTHDFKLDGDKVRELMIITMEECGELIQACSKVIRTMMSEGEIREDVLSKLKQEAADVICMVELIKENGLINDEEIQNGIEIKRNKLRRWSDLIPKRQTWQEILANEDE